MNGLYLQCEGQCEEAGGNWKVDLASLTKITRDVENCRKSPEIVENHTSKFKAI